MPGGGTGADAVVAGNRMGGRVGVRRRGGGAWWVGEGKVKTMEAFCAGSGLRVEASK